MSLVSIPVSGLSIQIDPCDIPSPDNTGVVRQKKHAFISPQSMTYAAPGGWKPITGASIALTGISPDRAVQVRMNVLIGRGISGIVALAVFRDNQMLTELPGAYVRDNGDLVSASPEWVDTGHGGGDHTYDFRWKTFSDVTYTGQRGDGNYVANVPGVMTAEEYQY